MKYKQGDEFSVRAPFLWHRTDIPADYGFETVDCWKPGFNHDFCGEGEEYKECHGFGEVIYTVVDYHALPKPYPARVFFTRKFKDPDGNVFGRNNLRIKCVAQFTRMVNQHCWPFNGWFDWASLDISDKPVFDKPVIPSS